MKSFILIIFSLYSYALNASSVSSCQQAESHQTQLKNTFYVLLKHTEAIVAANNIQIKTIATAYQQAEIYCPADTAALSRIHSNISSSSRVPLNQRISLEQIIKPILPVITDLIKQNKKNYPLFGFIVSPNQSVDAVTFEPSLLQGCRIFKLDHNPIDEKWFS